MGLIESVTCIRNQQPILLRRSYGVITAKQGELKKIQLRPWPKLGSLFEAKVLQPLKRTGSQDVCKLYYNQPLSHRNFLALAYVESSSETSLRTFYAALNSLNYIAYVKRSDAIIAEVTNPKISDRFLERRGWARFLEESSQRHWIKRFYGDYPDFVLRYFDQSVPTKNAGVPTLPITSIELPATSANVLNGHSLEN